MRFDEKEKGHRRILGELHTITPLKQNEVDFKKNYLINIVCFPYSTII